jgi:predicted restriction endonuclease
MNYLEPRVDYHKGKVKSKYSWRKRILERDDNVCRCCKGAVKDEFRKRQFSLEAHHIIPRRHGGLHIVKNGVTLCKFCHNYFDYTYSKVGLDYFQIMNKKTSLEIVAEVKRLLKRRYLLHLRRTIVWEKYW